MITGIIPMASITKKMPMKKTFVEHVKKLNAIPKKL
jgi:hypothetical protein